MIAPRIVGLGATFGLLLSMSSASPAAAQPQLDVPYDLTPEPVVSAMLKAAGTGPGDIVYDLGSGDGRIVLAAVRDFGARLAVGIDLDPRRVRQGRANAAKAGVSDRTRFVEGNVFTSDFSRATVLTMYLFPSMNRKLRPRILSSLKPGTRVVSHRFHMGEWAPDRTISVGDRQVYLWIVPAQLSGRWVSQPGAAQCQLDLQQEFQRVTGELRLPEGSARIENARLEGDRLRFEATIGQSIRRFDGRVAGEILEAVTDANGPKRIVLRRAK